MTAKTFFDHQQEAHSRTRWALLGFALAVSGVVAGVIGITRVVLMAMASRPEERLLANQLPVLGVAGGLALVIIVVSTLVRLLSMRGGPAGVMSRLGGWRVPPDTDDPEQRRLLNLVEEMSIASGVPVPEVYVMDEEGINACAVGLDVNRAAVAVTRGAMDCLTRDELQGVIAHEFSHILHGDMRLNTRLIAWLAGLFTLSELGRMLVYSVGHSRSRRSRDQGGGVLIALALGVAIWILGALGVLFGRLLQAGISRQREFLADASAVQFTRNPDGLGHALRKLGTAGMRGRITRPGAQGCAHMMFSNVRTMGLTGLMASHPPLPERIKRIDPSWDGSYLQVERPNRPSPVPKPGPEVRGQGRLGTHPLLAVGGMTPLLGVLNQVGLPDRERLQRAQAWLEGLPGPLRTACQDPTAAQALVYRLLLHESGEALQTQRDLLAREEESHVLEALEKLEAAVPALEEADRLPLLDLAIPALRSLEPGRLQVFWKRIGELSEADGTVDLFEYALRRITVAALEPEADARARSTSRIQIGSAGREVNVLLSVLSRLGADGEGDAEASFDAARQRLLGFHGGIELALVPADACSLEALDDACTILARLTPAFQQRVVLAGLAAVARDGEIRPAELEAFRAVAAALGVPVPPGIRVGGDS